MSYLKRLTNAALGRLQAYRMYGGIGMSASSLHRESTDSLILLGMRYSSWFRLFVVWSGSLNPRPPKKGGRPGTYCTCICAHALVCGCQLVGVEIK